MNEEEEVEEKNSAPNAILLFIYLFIFFHIGITFTEPKMDGCY